MNYRLGCFSSVVEFELFCLCYKHTYTDTAISLYFLPWRDFSISEHAWKSLSLARAKQSQVIKKAK